MDQTIHSWSRGGRTHQGGKGVSAHALQIFLLDASLLENHSIHASIIIDVHSHTPTRDSLHI